MMKLNKLQENSERQSSELRNKINEEKEYVIKETETLKKQTNRNSGEEQSCHRRVSTHLW